MRKMPFKCIISLVCVLPEYLIFYSFIVMILDESSSGSNYSADERKRKNAEKQKHAVLTKYSCNRIMHSPLPDSSPPSSPDRGRNIHSPLPDPSPPSLPIAALVLKSRLNVFKSAIHRDGGNACIL